MPIVDVFSKRQKKIRGGTPDVYSYDDLPGPLRVQIVQIWWAELGTNDEYYNKFYFTEVKSTYDLIVHTLRHEYGVFQLVDKSRVKQSPVDEFCNFFLNEEDVEKALDAVEMGFRGIEAVHSHRRTPEKAVEAVQELNQRFKEHGVGYEFNSPHIFRIDSEMLHMEVVKPALRLLDENQYVGARQEFLRAHEHYRKGNAKEALAECLKSFESVMKTICDKNHWSYSKEATSKSLIEVCFRNELIPSFWQSHYSSLRNLLESSVPTGRNKLGGHGQGTKPVSVPDYLVAYMLHMTGSALVFLAEAEKNLP